MRKVVRIALVGSMLNAPTGAFAQAPAVTPQAETFHAQVIRQEIASYGVGKKVDVTALAGKHLKGQISSIESEEFAIRYGSPSVTDRVRYQDVVEIRSQGMSTGAKVAIGTGVIVGIAVWQWVASVLSCSCSHGPQEYP